MNENHKNNVRKVSTSKENEQKKASLVLALALAPQSVP